MKKITEEIHKGKILVSDGAWGTYLQKSGLKPGECPELWNITHRINVLEIARAYADAGADIIETNSFGGSIFKLAHFGLGERTYELNRASAEISREAAGSDIIVMGSIGPTGKFILTGEVTEDQLYESFKQQVLGLRDGGADALCIETFYDLDEMRCAINAARENSALEIVSSFTFEKLTDGTYRSMMGISPSEFARSAIQMGSDIIGTNCGNGFNNMIDIVSELRGLNKLIPIIVQANAGLPEFLDGELKYPETPDFIRDKAIGLINAGANIIGGCCGTTPAHIHVLKEIAEKIN